MSKENVCVDDNEFKFFLNIVRSNTYHDFMQQKENLRGMIHFLKKI